MTVKNEIRISDGLANNPNFQAFITDLEAGAFKEMQPGTWVFYHGGQRKMTGMDRNELLKSARENHQGGGSIYQVGVKKENIDMPPYIEVV